MHDPSDPKTAVVTGATGGLGTSFVQRLAAQGYDLLLVDRHGEPLEEMCAQVADEHHVRAEGCFTDLSSTVEVAQLATQLATRDDIDMLVNNAGFGGSRFFVDVDIQVHVDTISVHVLAPVRLIHSVLPGMMERNRGAIINVSSLSAWTPSSCMVQYTATKAYLVTLSEALGEEVRGTNVRIQALCPGFVKTKFFDQKEMNAFDRTTIPRALWLTPDQVVNCSLEQLRKTRIVVVPGFVPKILGRLIRFPIAQPIVRMAVRRPRPKPE